MTSDPCPAPDVLAAFAGGELKGQPLDSVKAHLSQCNPCLETVGHLAARASHSGHAGLSHPTFVEAGQLIGAYRLISRVGEGGMGEVWQAQQLAPVKRIVAVKLLKAGMDTRQIIARFGVERQMLALMQHPGIAQMFDAGVTDAGRSYFVMEYVEGVRITTWCDDHKLGLRARLALFQHVCEAVQHAHQKGVIHRDLKPSNVLVTTQGGRPKVIDFGLAKAITPDLKDAMLTEFGTMLGTPAYASPEQMSFGEIDIDTRSDVYSLGALLYELLVGVIPFDTYSARAETVIERQLAMRERAPARPSVRVSRMGERLASIARLRGLESHSLRRQLRGELDWIVMKALERERERRYNSPLELSLDITRYLNHEPLTAGPPTTAYRIRKFVRRHRVGTAFAATLALVMIAFVAVTIVQAQRIAQQRDRATAEAANAELRRSQAEGLIGFMLGDLRERLEPVGKLDVLDAVGNQAMRYFAVLGSRGSEAEILARARALRQIGEVRFGQGRLEPALESFHESQRVLERLHDEHPANNDYLFELAQSEFWIGYVAWERKDFAQAERRMTRYMECSRILQQREPDNAAYELELVAAHSNLGGVARERGNPHEALRRYETSIALGRKIIAADPANTDAVAGVAEDQSWVGRTLLQLGRLQQSEDAYRAAVGLYRNLHETGEDRTYSQDYASLMLLLADVHLRQNEMESAQRVMDVSEPVLRSLTRHDPANARWQSLVNYAAMLRAAMSPPNAAESHLAAAFEGMQTLAQSDPTNAGYWHRLAQITHARAEIALRQGKPQRAFELAGRELEYLVKAVPETVSDRTTSIRLAMAHELRGAAAHAGRRVVEAQALWLEAQRHLENVSGEDLEALAVRRQLALHSGDNTVAASLDARLAAAGFRDPRFHRLLNSVGAVQAPADVARLVTAEP